MNEGITTTTTITATAVMTSGIAAEVVPPLICKNHGFILYFLFMDILDTKKSFLTVFENGKYLILETFL